MFQAALDRMKDRQTETEEFAAKMNRLTQRLDEEVKALDRMESFSETAAWLKRTEEAMERQAALVKDMGTALGSVIRFYRNCEEKILDHLEDGGREMRDENLTFTVPHVPEDWADLMEL